MRNNQPMGGIGKEVVAHVSVETATDDFERDEAEAGGTRVH